MIGVTHPKKKRCAFSSEGEIFVQVSNDQRKTLFGIRISRIFLLLREYIVLLD